MLATVSFMLVLTLNSQIAPYLSQDRREEAAGFKEEILKDKAESEHRAE